MKLLQGLRETWQLVRLSSYLLGGRRLWLPPLLPLLWPAFQALLLVTGARQESFAPEAAQGTLMGLPLAVLAIFLGVRVIAGEIDHRRLEIAYTVPGGAGRVWVGKLLAAWLLLAVAELLLAAVVFTLFTSFPVGSLYGAFQAASAYLVLSMGLATLFHGEVAGALVSTAVLVANGVFTGFGGKQTRLSPFFNPYELADREPSLVLAWTLQNRIGFALAILGLAALAFSRAERREKLLSG